jgi:hypothetical protein
MNISLPPGAVEVITIAPSWQIVSQRIAVLGMADKYASLAVIKTT